MIIPIIAVAGGYLFARHYSIQKKRNHAQRNGCSLGAGSCPNQVFQDKLDEAIMASRQAMAGHEFLRAQRNGQLSPAVLGTVLIPKHGVDHRRLQSAAGKYAAFVTLGSDKYMVHVSAANGAVLRSGSCPANEKKIYGPFTATVSGPGWSESTQVTLCRPIASL